MALIAWRRRTVLNWGEPIVRRRILTAAVMCALPALAGAVIVGRSRFQAASGSSTGEVVEAIVVDVATGASAGVAAVTVVFTLVWWVIRLSRGRGPARARGASRRVGDQG